MNPIQPGLRKAGERLLASPSAVFVAVLTAGLAIASLGHHTGLYRESAGSGQRSNVVLACPRTSSPAHSKAAAGATSSASTSRQKTPATASNSRAVSPTAAVANANVPAEKHQSGQTGKSTSGGGLSVPLPDFNAPELSRFISPL
jgi:hypothetical protein